MEDTNLKQFKKIEVIGKGYLSTIFKAFDEINKRYCALKIIPKYEIEFGNEMNHFLNGIEQEIENTKILKSKNIVELYDNIITNDSIILVLELCDFNLRNYINYLKEYDFCFIQKIFKELNNSFKIMNDLKIMHRDLKPENILIKIENGEVVPKLADFGASTLKKIDSEQIGTLGYMAPEILKGESYCYKADLFSLGVILYELIFSVRPFKGINEIALLKQMSNFGTKLLKKTGLQSLDDLLLGLLQIEPSKRFSKEHYLNHPFFIYVPIKLKQYKIQVGKIIKEEQEIDIYSCIENFNKINIMEIPEAYIQDSKSDKKINLIKIANVLYYDENIEKHLEEIHIDCDNFEKKTSGAFILCTNIFSLNLVMEEIKEYNTIDERVLFNLIVTGSKFEIVMDNLIKNGYEYLFKNICIYCMKVEKYSHLIEKY